MAEQVSQIKVEIDTEEAQAKLNQLYETQAKLVGEMSKVDEGSEAYKGLGDSLGETNKQIGSIDVEPRVRREPEQKHGREPKNGFRV